MAEVKVGKFVAYDDDGSAVVILVFRKLIDTTNMRTGPGTTFSNLASLRTADGLPVSPGDAVTYEVVGTGQILRTRTDPDIAGMRQEQP
jgi:hypothetical protein